MELTMSLRGEIISQRNFNDLPVFPLFPYSCKYCIYWESTADSDEKVGKSKAERIKRDWFSDVSRKFGNCGFIAYKDDSPVGYTQYASPSSFPRIQQYSSGPPSGDAVFLACLYVPRKELRGKGIGKYLLGLVLSDLQKRGYPAVETFARRGSESSPAGPLAIYLRNGFINEREKDEFPLVRRNIRK